MSSVDDEILERIGLGRLAPAVQRLEVSVVRELTEADLSLLASAKSITPMASIARIQQKHHAIARMIAAGKTGRVTAAALGYSESYISSLVNHDPAFKELVFYYQQQAEGEWLGAQELMGELGIAAMNNLARRIAEDMEALDAGLPPKMTTREVREVMDSAMERSIMPSKGQGRGMSGGSSAPVQVNITFPRLSDGEPLPKTIDITPKES